MINESELKALIYLLDDTDDDVVNQVEQRLFQLGPDVIPTLEQTYEQSDINELRQKRVDEIIRKIQSHYLIEELKKWKENNQDDLLEGALIINKIKYPEIDRQYIENILNKIKLDVWLELNYDLTSFEKIKILNYIMFDVHRFSGDNEDYHNPDNSYLSKVLDRKKGNPISLAIIYSLVAQRLNLPVFGVNLPQHFIVGYLEDKTDIKPVKLNESKFMIPNQSSIVQFYINPFNKGSVFPRENLFVFLNQVNIEPKDEYFLPCKNIEIIKRMVRNLHSSYEKLKNTNLMQQCELISNILEN
ncbi:MAG: transglutaminase family protein [Bacteroidia bacterium]|nr:transglutaminase family protein [Bacteroidia bacterium]